VDVFINLINGNIMIHFKDFILKCRIIIGKLYRYEIKIVGLENLIVDHIKLIKLNY